MQKVKQNVKRFLNFNGEPPGYRTRDTLIKRNSDFPAYFFIFLIVESATIPFLL